jgi:succinyl-CoA synthetase beta subunit
VNNHKESVRNDRELVSLRVRFDQLRNANNKSSENVAHLNSKSVQDAVFWAPGLCSLEKKTMAHKAIREYDGKKILAALLPQYSGHRCRMDDRLVKFSGETNLLQLRRNNPWLGNNRLVAKLDQLVKRRMRNGLVLLDASWKQVTQWLTEHIGKETTVDHISGRLDTFLIEPFRPHDAKREYYLAMRTLRDGDEILFCRHGGITVGDVETKARRLLVTLFEDIDNYDIENLLLDEIEAAERELIADYIRAVHKIFAAADFVFLEINPLVVIDHEVVALDLAARLDDTASQDARLLWGPLAFPPPFGKAATAEEDYIRSLDENSGASLKLTLLKPEGRIWTLLAGGGASVVFTDTIADLGLGSELANYGEYSGDPTDEETYEYTKTVLDLMTRQPDRHLRGKVLIIGGGIANFTDVAKTFRGISKALSEYRQKLKLVGAKVYVRRGGPNYQEGIRNLKTLAPQLGIPIEVYGPETHMTRIVKLALNA